MLRPLFRLAPLALLFLAAGASPEASAQQPITTGYGTVTGLPTGARNSVTTLAEADGRLFAGPRLVIVEADGTVRFVGNNGALNPATSDQPRAFSIAARPGGRVLVGIGFTDDADPDTPISTAAGFAVSQDGGQTFGYRPAPLDASTDVTVTYGVSTLRASPIFTSGDAAPFDVAIDPASGDLYSANAIAGLRVSRDDGATWQRVVLPPDTLRTITPEAAYAFPYTPAGVQLPGATEPGDVSLYGFNFIAYSVLVDEEGTVWAGTLAGLNRGEDSTVVASGDRAWTRYEADAARPSPAGSFIVSLQAREIDGARDEIWMAAWPSGRSPDFAPNAPDERFGVSIWRGDDENGEAIFETVLLGERVYDLAFRGEAAYAAGQNGLFVSDDAGRAWRALRSFRDASGAVLPIRPGTGVFSVSVTDDGTIWAGTGDGLLRSEDGGSTWALFRSNVPTNPTTLGEDTPEVEAYAYPNPFSPRSDRLTRIRFDLFSAADVRVRIFDFGMRLVADIDAGTRRSGANEVEWTGTADGARVANGTYIYVVDAGDTQLSGKILVLD
ncbi:FlgD immunoglobulin-like domain containing protein [Rubricoccus marinus]|uniref:FlgD/Vpr Ig-like domain-containing protein n=1 Tax=Rubricoccus marinus TaxID=716817 RepID=A0A259TWT2_9BACT|nr:FlgD immunoglobulin-like domain containing protein [Rubricoccus marinus]OZC02156.1 hypothetical protein BSZ36_03640 [Rubricoccus marinus]